MRKLLGAYACGLLLCACSAQAVDSGGKPSAEVDSSDAMPAAAMPVADVSLYQQHCSICHLEAGQGVPGAFPPLDARLTDWAANEAGQGYLASVVANGLYGVIQVNGQQYAGAMPGLAGQLTNAEIAGVLNYVLIEFAGSTAVFTPVSVAAQLSSIGVGPSLPLRPE